MLYADRLTKNRQGAGYPFDVPVIANMTSWQLNAPVTILCGDNGCGKSTLLSLLAAKLNAVRIGQGVIERERAAEAAEGAFTLRKRAARHNFFFSAEDFIAYIGWVSRAKEEARRELIRIREDDAIPDKAYASMPYAHTLEDLAGLYAGDLACRSHGEGFLDFFISRLHPDGLYLLDEPEGALSFEKQYALALTIWEGAKDSQFILATHSPILTAIPGAEIIEIVDGVMKRRRYEELSHIQFLRLFLERPERMFR